MNYSRKNSESNSGVCILILELLIGSYLNYYATCFAEGEKVNLTLKVFV